MTFRMTWIGLVVLLFGSAFQIFSQTEPAIDPAVYLAFFRQAAGRVVLQTTGEASALNGEPTDLVPQSIQDAMGITDREAKAVIEAAVGCGDEIKALDESARTLVFESRLRAANDEKLSDDLAEKLREIEERRVGIIMRHVERLKSSLDSARFKAVEDYIRSRQSDGAFFPAVNSPRKKL